jgi:hypothetical protein
MMKSQRSKRRFREKTVQKNRLSHIPQIDVNSSSDARHVRRIGKLKHGNESCGCHMCKPWKFGLEPALKFSDRKKLLREFDE